MIAPAVPPDPIRRRESQNDVRHTHNNTGFPDPIGAPPDWDSHKSFYLRMKDHPPASVFDITPYFSGRHVREDQVKAANDTMFMPNTLQSRRGALWRQVGSLHGLSLLESLKVGRLVHLRRNRIAATLRTTENRKEFASPKSHLLSGQAHCQSGNGERAQRRTQEAPAGDALNSYVGYRATVRPHMR